MTDEQLAGAMAARTTWQAELAAVLHETPVLAPADAAQVVEEALELRGA